MLPGAYSKIRFFLRGGVSENFPDTPLDTASFIYSFFLDMSTLFDKYQQIFKEWKEKRIFRSAPSFVEGPYRFFRKL